MLPATEPIPRRKLSDAVFDRLKRMITGDDVRPGDLMPSERQLMERSGSAAQLSARPCRR